MPDFGLIQYNLPYDDLERFASYASGAGFGFVELPVGRFWNEADSDTDALAHARAVRELLSRHGLRISAVSAGNDFLQPDQTGLERQVQRLRRVCALAREAGTDLIRIDGGWSKDSVPQDRWRGLIVQALQAIRPFVEREGYTLALDNHGLVTNDADLEVSILSEVGSPRIGANVDTMNYRWAGHDLATVNRFYHVIAPWARHVHIKDGRGSRGEYRGTVLGAGELDLERALAELRAAGYAGVWTVEYEGPRAEAEDGYRRGLQWLKDRIR